MIKTICDICGEEIPTEKTEHIENLNNLNFCISSNGKIWDICDKCRVSLNKWMLNIRFGLSLKEGQNEDSDSTDFGSYYAVLEQQKTGQWKLVGSWSEGSGMGEQYGGYYKCSLCGKTVKVNGYSCEYKCCPNCMSKMEEGQNGDSN